MVRSELNQERKKGGLLYFNLVHWSTNTWCTVFECWSADAWDGGGEECIEAIREARIFLLFQFRQKKLCSFLFRETKLCSFLLRETKRTECWVLLVPPNRRISDEKAVSFVFFRISQDNFWRKLETPNRDIRNQLTQHVRNNSFEDYIHWDQCK